MEKTADIQFGEGATAHHVIRHRFERLADTLRTQGALAGTGHKRIVIPKDKLTEEDVHALGFVPVKIAIPEAGQDRWSSFRHPDNLFHIHSHPEGWTMHEDAHPSSTMLSLKAKGMGGKVKAFATGAPHVSDEGLPGLYYYLKGRAHGQASTAQNVLNELDPRVVKRIQGWRPSPTYQAPVLPPAAPAPDMKVAEMISSVSPLSMVAFLDELEKVGTITDDQAMAAMERYNAAEVSKPTAGQVARYAALGAVSAPIIGGIGQAIRGGRELETTSLLGHLAGVKSKNPLDISRGVGSSMAMGAIGASAIPYVRTYLDQRADKKLIAKHLAEKERSQAGTGGAIIEPFVPVPESAGGVSKLASNPVTGLTDERIVERSHRMAAAAPSGKLSGCVQKKEKDSAALENTPASKWSGQGIYLNASFGEEKQAETFASSDYNSNIGYPSIPQVSPGPGMTMPSTRGALVKRKVAEFRKVALQNSLGKSPAQLFAAGKKVGAPHAPSYKTPGSGVSGQTNIMGKTLPGANKGTIGKSVPKFTPTMAEAPSVPQP